MKLGYLVPEFPGQTHAFFWREISAIEDAATEVDIVSTRRPRAALMSHTWTSDAVARTSYLQRPGLGQVAIAAAVLLRSAFDGRLAETLGVLRPSSLLVRAQVLLTGALLAARARQQRWTHVHSHSAGSSALIALSATKLSPGLTYSLTLHGSLGDYGGQQELKWENAAFALVITETLRDTVRVALAGHLPPSIDLAPMGVDASALTREAPYATWTRGAQLRIFSCGRLNPAKGHDTVISAVRILRDEGLDVRLSIAGEDDDGGTGYRLVIERLISDLELSDAVTLLGAISDRSVRDELEQAHVFVLASHAEPLGVAIMEAMAMCVPVVVGDGGGVRELLADGAAGVLVPPRSPEALATAMVTLVHDPSHLLAMTALARARVVDQYSSQASARVLSELARTTSRGSDASLRRG